jgi:tetratricopeptide (TPR) repeat protein
MKNLGRMIFPETATEEDFLDYITKHISSNDLNLFVGAGISKDPPSNLPLAQEFRMYVYNKLCTCEKPLKVFGKYVNKLSSIPFESFIKIVVDESNFFNSFLRIFKSGQPNKAHRLIAKLVKKGYILRILTTNFDMMLEQALAMEGVSLTDVDIYYTEAHFDGQDLSSIKRPIICKIHGSVNAPDSVRVTLDLITREILQQSRTNILNYFFKESNKDLLILGYSCSDEFDINPYLGNLKSKTKIFVIKHSTTQFKIENLQRPFETFPGNLIACDTRRVIDQLCEKFVKTEFKDEGLITENWKKEINNWHLKLDPEQRFSMVGNILLEVGELEAAIQAFNRGIRKSKKNKRIAYLLNNCGRAYVSLGDFEKAFRCFHRSLPLLVKLKEDIKIAETYHFLGLIKKIRGNYNDAEKFLKESLKMCQNRNYMLGTAIVFDELGTLYQRKGDFKGEKALTINKRIGNIRGVAVCLNQIGTVTRIDGDLGKAEKLTQESLEIRRKIGDKQGIAACLHELALVAASQRKLDVAENLFRKTLQILNELGDRSRVAWTLHDLAGVFIRRGNYTQAEELIQQSLSIKKSFGDQRGIAISMAQLGVIRLNQNEMNEAEELLNSAYKICQKLKDKRVIIGILENLEKLYAKKRDFKKVAEIYKEILQLT